MNKVEFNARWDKARQEENAFITCLCNLFYKKPLDNGETREERRKKQVKEFYYRQKKKIEKKKVLFENDEKRRAMEELARFTPEERKRFDEWEVKQNVSC